MCFSSIDDCKLLDCKSESQFKLITFFNHEFKDSHTVLSQWMLSVFNKSKDWACDLKNCSAMNLWFDVMNQAQTQAATIRKVYKVRYLNINDS